MNENDLSIWMERTRFAAVIRAFLEKYPEATVKLNHKVETRPIDEWCTKRKLSYLIDFSLSLNNKEILSFHGDSVLLAAEHELSLVRELASKKMVRYAIITPKLRHYLVTRKQTDRHLVTLKQTDRRSGFFARFFGKKT